MKKLIFNSLALVAFVVSLSFTSCKDETEAKTGIDALIEQGVLTGELDHQVTLESKTYKLTGTFVVKSGATLTVPAGARIVATEGYGSYIIVAQGGKININGTAAKPVVMTADDESKAKAGYWGGLVINGKAKISGASEGVTAICEMNSKFTYGGTDDNDNSGSITYLIMKYAGARSSADVEHNGLTLDAVGRGTKIENIYIYENADDGIECFGGSVDLKNVLVVNQDDDMFDCTQGYKGKWENFYGVWEGAFSSTEVDPRGVEADGNFDGKTPNDINQSNFTVVNMTFNLKLANDPSTTNGKLMYDVIKLRRGAKATISNVMVTGTGAVQDLVDCTDSKGDAATGSTINITNSLTNTITGSASKPGANTAAVTVSTTNTGCSKDIFAWTGYTNF